MTAKEKMATAVFKSSVQSAVSQLKYYQQDNDLRGLQSIIDDLQEAISEFKKVTKI